MANKDQKRGNKEVRKPKQAKASAPVQQSQFTGSLAMQAATRPPKKK